MSLKTDCLDDVVGLSRNPCNCFDVPANESLSGIYLDELEGLNLNTIDAASDCDDAGSVWYQMRAAMEQAIIALKTDFLDIVTSNFKISKPPFSGNIGRTEFNTNMTITSYAGVKVLCAPIKAGVIRIKRIGALFNGTGTFDVVIYNNISDAPIKTVSITSGTGKHPVWTSLDEVLELPMYSQDVSHLQYYFIYQTPGFAARNNNFKCCSFSPGYNVLLPQFRDVNDARYRWYQFVNVSGTTGATLDDVTKDTYTYNDAANGLIIDCEIKCSLQDIPCYDLDFNNSPVAKVFAHALRYKAGTILIQNILSSPNLSIYTMTDRERLYQENARYKSEYLNRLMALATKADLASTGCLQCDRQMSVNSLLGGHKTNGPWALKKP